MKIFEFNPVTEPLHTNVLRWIHRKGWSSLTDIQSQALPHILPRKHDVLLIAGTASGKTEACYLPVLSRLLTSPESGVQVIGILPTKALINDQFARLQLMTKDMSIPVMKWHGDVHAHRKQRFIKKPEGILLITPESLEGLLVRHPQRITLWFSYLQFVVIDECHTFIGDGRGLQLMSLLNRIRQETGRVTPRIGLSATVGDVDGAQAFLQLGQPKSHPGVVVKSHSASDVKIAISGYQIKAEKEGAAMVVQSIAKSLMNQCRGTNNLVFANSRMIVEALAHSLTQASEHMNLPNEFFPHHGSLSAAMRESVEQRLHHGRNPTTVIATSTLEVGVDVGDIDTVYQVNPPPSVSSLRQRLGRSGRRGEPSSLHLLALERQISPKNTVYEALRMSLFQQIACVHLMLVEKWCEPELKARSPLAILTHQILALIAQLGSITAKNLYKRLIVDGVFDCDIENFTILLKYLGRERLITQLSSGGLTLGDKGEPIVMKHDFLSVFHSPSSVTLLMDGKALGTVPVDALPGIGSAFVFSGKGVRLMAINQHARVAYVVPAKASAPPAFLGEAALVHSKVRETMRHIYLSGQHDMPGKNGKEQSILNDEAMRLFNEGRKNFTTLGLMDDIVCAYQGQVYLMTFTGDAIVNTLSHWLSLVGEEVASGIGLILFLDAEGNVGYAHSALSKLNIDNPPSEDKLVGLCADLLRSKWDSCVPESILKSQVYNFEFDVEGTIQWITWYRNVILD
ncbi:DEAD/DEAH box helicase [Vibrio splendidus]